MTRRWMRILSMAALAPLAVDVPGEGRDSASTSVMVSVGAGSYAAITRGCDNQVLHREKRYFRDTGFELHHDTPGPLEFGVRGTVLRRIQGFGDNSLLLNPNVSLEGENIGIGAGFVAGTRSGDREDLDLWPVSGHIRFGSKYGRFHVSMHALEDVPLISGGGAFRAGLGFRPSNRVETWVGYSSPDPYDNSGLVFLSNLHLNRNLTINLAGRVGASSAIDENAGAIGVTYRFPHPRRAASTPDSTH
jgi:hypothetical protein